MPMIRKLIVTVVVVVVLVVAVLVGNQIAVRHTESTIASRIEQRVPGARASVTIPSSGFLLHLAASGTIQDIHAHVTGVTDGDLHFDSVDIAVQDLKVDRSDLVHGSVHLVSLAQAASAADRADPQRREQVGRGWQVFKRQLHFHHTGEDRLIWPRLADRLAHSESAMSTLEAMESEHALVDPLLEAVDAAFADPAGDELAGAVDELVTTLHGHLAHEERDALPLIGTALTVGEWRAVGRRIGLRNLRRSI